MQQTVRVAAAQAESAWLDLAAGADKVISLIGEAAADRGLRGEARSGGAQMIAFGETFIPGYPWWIWLDCPAAGMAFVPQYAANSTTRPRNGPMSKIGAPKRIIEIEPVEEPAAEPVKVPEPAKVPERV